MPSEIITIPTEVPLIRIIYDFISESEEKYLISKVDLVGGDSSKVGNWTDLNGRRSMHWGGTVISLQTLIPAPFPSFMDVAWPNILGRITETGVFEETIETFDRKGKGKGPNHCLVNEYIGSLKQGIMPHTDGPAYDPVVATLSLGSHTILTLNGISTELDLIPSSSSSLEATSSASTPSSSTFTSSTTSPSKSTLSIFLPPRSLLILSCSLYSSYLHAIEPKTVDLMTELMSCSNWESWWLDGARGLESSTSVVVAEEGEGGEGEEGMERIEEEGEGEDEEGALRELRRKVAGTSLASVSASVSDKDEVSNLLNENTVKEKSEEELVRDLVARRRMVELGTGWERGRRISLTCRRVGKVRKGLRLG